MDKIKKISMGDFKEIKGLCLARWPNRKRWMDKETLRYYLKKNARYCLKYLGDGKILGFTLAMESHNCLRLDMILVDKNQRGKGKGRKLLEYLEKICRRDNLQTIFLSSGEEDYTEGSFNFYTTLGFQVAGSVYIHREKIMYFEKDLTKNQKN